MQPLTPKQKQVLAFIEKFSEIQGYPPTVREICHELGIKSPNTVHVHLKALKEKGYVHSAKGKNRGLTVVQSSPETSRKLPLVGSIAAGSPILAVENLEETLDVDRTFFGTPAGFCVQVQGDSMIDAHITQGDFVVIEPGLTPKNGDIVAALVGEEVTLKYFFKRKGRAELVPANDKYAPLVFSPDEAQNVRILGVMAGLVRKC